MSTESFPDVAATLRRLAQDMFDQRSIRDLELTLSQIVAAAVDVVPGAVGGGISRTDEGSVRSGHATDEFVGRLDALQSELNEGPCVTAATDPPDSGVVFVDDLAGDDADRWPRFAPRAVELGYRSMVSTNLGTRPGGPRSALNLYGVEPSAFGEQARQTAALFAVQAAAILYGADEAEMLGRALHSRDVIGQAKGILMERFTIDAVEAFQMLVRSSQDTNMKLVDVARWLTDETAQRRVGTGGPSETAVDVADR